MSSFFKPYEGKRPYLFVSYSHRQSDEVVGTIRLLHERRWRLWYDEGIPAGSDWPKNIETHMRQSAAVLFFLSQSALDSPNCFSEIQTALELNKSVLVLPLEDAAPDGEWAPLLKKCRFLALASGAADRAEEIEKSGFLKRGYHRRPLEDFRWDRLGLAASLLLFACTLAAVYGLFTGRIALPGLTPDTVQETPAPAPPQTPRPDVDLSQWESFFPVAFPDSQQERAIRSILGKAEGDVLLRDLPEIRALYLGKVTDLSVIGRMPNLEGLALIRQPVSDLRALAQLTLLRELSLAGTAAESLDALGAQPSLEILHLEHSAVRDLSPLGPMRALRSVTVSAEMLPLRWDEGAAFDVILVP